MENLTKREVQIVERIAFGFSTKEIADEICRSERTVVNTIQSVYNKLHIRRSYNALTAWYYITKFNLEIDGIPLKNRIIAIWFFFLILPNTLNLEDKQVQLKRLARRNIKKEYALIVA